MTPSASPGGEEWQVWSASIDAAADLGTGATTQDLGRLLAAEAPTMIDLTDPGYDRPLAAAADLLAASGDRETLAALDGHLAREQGPLAIRLSAKLALSRRAVLDLEHTPFVSVVFAVYQEHERIRTRAEHPAGEDFLNRKLAQLEWLFRDRPSVEWELIVVDDGCPDGSGHLAQEIITRSQLETRARVLFLADAIDAAVPVTTGLRSADASRKGGSILLGMWEALETPRPNHVVVYTDADMSTHLGQTGLLLDALERGAACAAGSRREPTSAVVKTGTRNERGKLFIYLWKRLLAPLGDIVDTQCGFKAFPGAVASEVTADAVERRFAFDVELLLKTALLHPGKIHKVPIAWIDSEALSTTTDLQPYLPMLRSIVTMYRKYLPKDATADAYASLIDGLSDAAWDRLVEAIPTAITERDPAEFGEFAGVPAEALAGAAGSPPLSP